MASSDRIGVVTVTYNSAGVLPDFLRCLAAQSHANFILYAVDNASKDETLRLLHEWKDDRLRVIANPDNRGVAEGNNQGIRAALADGCASVLLLNNDTTFDPGLIHGLDAGLEQYAVDMTCPKILYYNEPNRIWAAGGELQPWLGYRSRHFGVDAIDDGSYDKPIQISYVPTCCVLIKDKVFERIGLMDPHYFVYVDDVDFMYRAHKAGLKLIYLPQITLAHRVGGSTGGKDSPFTVRYCTRNRVYYLLKHFGILGGLPWLMIYQAYFWYRLAFKGDSVRDLMHRQQSFREGFKVYKESGY